MRRFLVLAGLLGITQTLPAQPAPVVAIGSRVRIQSLQGTGLFDRGIEGTITRIAGDTLLLFPKGGGESLLFPSAAGTQVYVLTGRRISLLKGGMIGALSGTLVGAFVGAAAGKVCEDPVFCAARRQISVNAALLVGAAGAAVGMFISALNPHNVWTQSTNRSAQPVVSLGGPAGAGLGLSFSF